MHTAGSRCWVFAVLVMSLIVGACSRKEPVPDAAESPRIEPVETTTQALNPNPQVADFALYGTNSISVQNSVAVNGADVGVKNTGAGPFLVTGFELAIGGSSTVNTARNVIADSVQLGASSVVGSVQTNQLQDLGGVHGTVTSFVAMPAMPSVSAVTTNTTDRTIANNTVTTLPAAQTYRNLTIGNNAIVRLTGGVYNAAQVTLGQNSRIEALAAAELHIAGRIAVGTSSTFGPASGTILTARDLRIEVSGINGTTGALTATPSAASFAGTNQVRALVIVPNGLLTFGTNSTLTGAMFGRDVRIGGSSQVTYQNGFTNPGCPSSCDDANPCTTDACVSSACTHTPVASGTACSDGNACNGSETCNTSATCVVGMPPVLDDGNPCTTDACAPATGVTHTLVAAGTACADGNACNGAETCNASGTCTAGAPPTVNDGNACTTDTCDPVTGVSHTPVAAGTSCSDANACNGAETCNASASCVAGTPPVVDDGNPCTTDACDPATGLTHVAAAPGTSCSDGNGCNGPETCNASAFCQSGVPPVIDDGNPCTADTCDPVAGIVHVAVPAGTSCGDGNACNGAETCNASAVCQPGAPIVCSASDQCHNAGNCDPGSGACSSPAKSDGTTCNDSNACTATDTCQAGACTGTGTVATDDNNACTTDACDPAGGVTHTPVATGTSCSDNNACNGAETCNGSGSCTAGTAPPVDDSNACTTDSCDPATGVHHAPVAAGSACSDGNACNGAETCDANGSCSGGTPVVCTAQDQCHVVGTCDPGTGACTNPAKADSTACTDSNACTQSDTCQSGTCTGSNPVVCTMQDQCHSTGTCDTATGVCSNPTKNDGSACSDDNACTQTDTCQSGMCTGSNPVTCSAQDQCHTAGTCDTATGTCSNPAKADGTTCNDTNACTQTDSCQSGACAGGNPVTCTASDQCHTPGTCDSATGACSNPAKTDGTSCNDGNACTQADVCQTGTCTGASPVVCTASDACHAAGVCNPASSQCSNPNAPDGTACSDGKVCTQTDACQAGACVGTNPVTCTALDQCHVAGTCDASSGCSNPSVANGTSCSDGNACTESDTCETGICQSGAPVPVDDGNPCTADSCDPAGGVAHTPTTGASCSDGNACNGAETCNSQGSCTPGTAVSCTASDTCHDVGTCDPATGACSNPAKANGAPCTDGNACTQGDVCTSSACTPTGATPIDDGDLCTTDSCDSATGAQHTPIPGCVANPTDGDGPFETRASLIGQVVTTAGTPVIDYTLTVFDAPAGGSSRTDVQLTTASDGSFRARLTQFPDQEVPNSPPHHLIVFIDSPNTIRALRDAYLHPSNAVDFGKITVVARDPQVTSIGPAGGTATDSQGLVEVQIPPGATNETIPVRITPLTEREHLPFPLPSTTATTYAFELEPHGTTFEIPITVRMQNFRGLPAGIQIPVGYVDTATANWIHEGWAVWDGTKFGFQTTHFSTHDANSDDRKERVYTLSQGSNPNNSATNCGIGSSVGVSSGSLGQSLSLPTYQREGRSYGVTLNYDSGLAGSRVYGQHTSDGVTTKDSVPHGSSMQSATSMVLSSECVSAASAGGCGSGQGCGGISSSSSQVAWSLKWRGAGSESTTSGSVPGNANEIEMPGGFVIPKSDPSHITGSGFLQTQIQISLPGKYKTAGGTCAGGGGTFGVQQTNTPSFPVPGLEPGPAVELTQHVFIHHRYSSPFGVGWGISQIGRAYADPAAEQVVVVHGDGREENFVPRHVAGLVLRQPNREPTQVAVRDANTGENFIVTGSGTITRVEANGTPTSILSGLALGGRLWSAAIAYVDGERRFVTAGTTQVTEVQPSGQTNVLATRTPPISNSQFTRANIAARGELAFYTSGLDSEPVLQMMRLSDPGRTFAPITTAAGGDVKIDPMGAISTVSLAAPRGLAFADDGSLYLADAARHLIFRILPLANGEIGPDSHLEHVIGNGSAGTMMPLGEHGVGVQFPVASPLVLSMAPGGTLWIATTYGLANYNTQSTEAKWLLFDQNIRASEFPMMLLDAENSGGGASVFGIDADSFWANDVVDAMYRFDIVTRSEYEPTRTLVRDALGITLTDTTADTIELFDGQGRFVERHMRTGEPVLAASYVDPTSSRIDRIADPTGAVTQFAYDSRGKLQTITDPAGRTTTVEIDTAGDVKSIKMPDEELYQFAYDEHHMKSKTSPRQEVTNYTYDPAGTLSTSTKPTGEQVTVTASMSVPNAYDSNGILVRAGGTMVDAHNVTHHYTVTGRGDIMEESYTADGVSYTLQNVYAPSLAPGEAQFPVPLFYSVPNRIYRVATRKLNGVQIEPYRIYDELGRVLREERAPNATGILIDNIQYGSDGRVSSIKFGSSNTTQMVDRDTAGRVSRLWDKGFFGAPTGRQSTFTWRSDGQSATMTKHGVTTTFTYDDAGGTRLLTGAADTAGQHSSFGHDAAGNINFYDDGATSGRYTYDSANRMTISEDANAAQTLFSYNLSDCGCQQGDQLASIRTPDLPANKSWKFTYTNGGRIQTLTDPDGYPEAYDYETTGELKQLIDRNGKISSWTHDQLGRELTFKDALDRMHKRSYPVPVSPQWSGPNVMAGSGSTTATTTDIAATLGNGDYQVGLNLYRDSGFPAQVEFYRDATFELSNGMEFDNVMRMTLRKDRGNLPVSSTSVFGSSFNGFFEQTSYEVDTAAPIVKYSSGNEGGSELTHNVEFDLTQASGSVLPAQGNSADYTFGRDSAGKLTSVGRSFLFGESVPASTITYKPNQRQVDRVVDEDGTHDLLYDLRGLVQTQTVTGEGTYTYGYDAVGRNTSLAFPDGHTRVQGWDAEGRLISRCYQYSDPSKTRCYGATYDAAGNPLTLTDPEGTDTVEYDALYRVKKVTRSSPGNPNVVENYGYNAPGALKINAGSVLDDQRPKKVGSGTADAGVPATYGGQPVTLDANGRITSLEGKTFTWNTRGWPLTATVGGATEKYRQDALGRLVVRDQTSPPADYYVYDDIGGMNVVGMRRWAGASPPGSSGRLLQQLDNFLYDGVDHPIRLQHRAVPGDTTFQTAYFELDLTGNVRRLRGTTGEDLGGYRYTAFGKAYPSDATTPQAQVDQPLRWKGRWFNALTGLYDVRARQWSPELGVFVSADEFGLMRKDSTLWGWPGQNPLRWSDPTGQDPLPERTIAELAPFFPGFDLRQIDVQQNVSLGQVEGQQIIAQTNGNVISFSENTYYPLTVDGIASIAHEVTHAYQQAQHPPGWFWFTDPNSVEQLQYGYNNTSAEVQARLIEAAFRQYLRKKYGLAARDIEGLGDDLVCH